MNRRQFSVGAGGAALSALSYSRVLGANERLGVALVGSGRRGREVMKAMLDTGRAELRCLCDVYDVQRRRAREALGMRAPETVALEEALARRDVDAVLIATPDHLHLDQTLAALEAGKHVYLEKPAVHRPEEGARLIAAARASGKVCQTGTQQRSGGHYRRAREEIFAPNKLGKVVLVRAVWSNFPWQARRIAPSPRPEGLDWERFLGGTKKIEYEAMRYDAWRYFPEYGGGLLSDILTHWADVAQWMMGESEPRSAVAAGGIYHLRDGRVNPDTVSAIIQYPGGWSLTFESTVLPILNERPSVVFQGTEGTLDIARDGYVFRPHKGEAATVRAAGSLETAHALDFLDAVKTGRRPSADIEIGVEACRPVHLARAAYWEKKGHG